MIPWEWLLPTFMGGVAVSVIGVRSLTAWIAKDSNRWAALRRELLAPPYPKAEEPQ